MMGVKAQQPVMVSSSLTLPPFGAKLSGHRVAVRCRGSADEDRRVRREGGESGLFAKLRSPAFHVLQASPSLVACSPKHRNGRGALGCRAGFGFEVSPTTIAVLSSVLGFAAVRTYVYFRMEYIIAAMLGRHVPRGGARVVELNIRGGRNLYYYPSDTVQVVAFSSKPNKELLENQAIRAGVPIEINTKARNALGLLPGSMDAVVSVNCFNEIPDKEVAGVLHEAVRVLKPGKPKGRSTGPKWASSHLMFSPHPFIFVEAVGAKNVVIRSFQGAFGGLSKLVGSKRVTQRDLLPYIRELKEFEDVEFEEVFGLVDPHVVGIAKKKLPVVKEKGPQESKSKESRKGSKKSKA